VGITSGDLRLLQALLHLQTYADSTKVRIARGADVNGSRAVSLVRRNVRGEAGSGAPEIPNVRNGAHAQFHFPRFVERSDCLLATFLHPPSIGGWDRALFILAIGLFWFWIALNIEQFAVKRTVATFDWGPLRVLSDLLVMAVGGLVGLSAVSRAWWWIPRMDVPNPQWLWIPGSMTWLPAWSFILLFLFGRDLVLSRTE